MEYKVLFSEPTLKQDITSATFNEIGQVIERNGYKVRLDNIIEEPTESKTGTALITKTSAYGAVSSQTATISKKSKPMDTKQRNYLLGRATALIERITDMPHRVVAKIAAHPIDMVQTWLVKATINDQDELMEVMRQIDEIPTFLTISQQGDFWMGYYKQCNSNTFREKIGSQLKSARISKEMSIAQVAELAQMTEATVSKIENGKWSVSLDTLERVCSALGVTISLAE